VIDVGCLGRRGGWAVEEVKRGHAFGFRIR
jgi:hypothetical protein